MREFGSEHPSVILPDNYFKSLENLGMDVMYLRSGREALLLASIVASTKKDKIILFPAYCCWSMSAPFEKAGWTIHYYRLNEDLTVNIDYLEYLLDTLAVDAVFTMNFYGSANTDDAVELVKTRNERTVIIEDFSHCTFAFKQIFNKKVDIYVSSIRKSVGVCDGAIILSGIPMSSQYVQNEQSEFSDCRYQAQIEKWQYSFSKNQKSKDSFLNSIRKCEEILNGFTAVRPISNRAMQMLSLINGCQIAYARRENMKHLIDLLKGKVETIPNIERCLDKAPFSLPILVDNRDDVQKRLAGEGIYAPVLWPICSEAQRVCSVSKSLAEKMLSIPVDQRYDWDDMEEIASRILKVCSI